MFFEIMRPTVDARGYKTFDCTKLEKHSLKQIERYNQFKEMVNYLTIQTDKQKGKKK